MKIFFLVANLLLTGLEKLAYPDKPIPKLETEIAWDEYWAGLAENDQKNLQLTINRLTVFARRHKMPIGIMAVGSAVRKNGRRGLVKPGVIYGDIDWLLMPLRSRDINRSKKLLRAFITTQKEILRDKKGKIIESRWFPWDGYDSNNYWDHAFPKGVRLQLFVPIPIFNETLWQKVKREKEFFKKRYFALYQIKLT